MPRIPTSTDPGPAPGQLGIQQPEEVVRQGQLEIAELRSVGRAISQLGRASTQAGLELRRRQIQTEINNETLSAKENLLLQEADLRRRVMEDPEIPNTQKSSAFLEEFGQLSDELLEGLRFDASRLDVRQSALSLARDAKLRLDRESATAQRREQSAHIDRLSDEAARAALEGDTERLSRVQGDLANALDRSRGFLSEEEIDRESAKIAQRVQSIQLGEEMESRLEEGDLEGANDVLSTMAEDFPALDAEFLIRFREQAESRIAGAQGQIDEAEQDRQEASDQETVNSIVEAAATLEARIENLSVGDVASLTGDPEARTQLDRLNRERTAFVRGVEARLPGLRRRLSSTEFERVLTTLENVTDPAEDNVDVRASLESSFADPDVTPTQRRELLELAHRTRLLSDETYNNLIATNRSMERSAVGGDSVSRILEEMDAAFGRTRGAIGFSQDESMDVKLANARSAFFRFVAANPEASEQDLREESIRILRSLGEGPSLDTIVPPPTLTQIMEEEKIDLSQGAEGVRGFHLDQAEERLVDQLERGEITEAQAENEMREIERIRSLRRLQGVTGVE